MRKIGLITVLLAAVVILLPSFASNDKKLSPTYQKLLEDKFYVEWKKGVDSEIGQIENLQI